MCTDGQDQDQVYVKETKIWSDNLILTHPKTLLLSDSTN